MGGMACDWPPVYPGQLASAHDLRIRAVGGMSQGKAGKGAAGQVALERCIEPL